MSFSKNLRGNRTWVRAGIAAWAIIIAVTVIAFATLSTETALLSIVAVSIASMVAMQILRFNLTLDEPARSGRSAPKAPAAAKETSSTPRDILGRIKETAAEGSEYLEFSEKSLTRLPAEIGGLTALKNLVLGSNELTSLPPEFAHLTALTKLDLGWNKFAEFPMEICELSGLKELSLASNDITALPPEIGRLQKLEKLEIHHCKITALPPEIGRLTALKHLDLRSNGLTELPPEFGKLKKLEWLMLGDNQLSELPPETARLWKRRYAELLPGNENLTRPPLTEGATAAKLLRDYPARKIPDGWNAAPELEKGYRVAETRRLMDAIAREWDTLDKPIRVARALEFAVGFAKNADLAPTDDGTGARGYAGGGGKYGFGPKMIASIRAAEAAGRVWLDDPSRRNAKAARRIPVVPLQTGSTGVPYTAREGADSDIEWETNAYRNLEATAGDDIVNAVYHAFLFVVDTIGFKRMSIAPLLTRVSAVDEGEAGFTFETPLSILIPSGTNKRLFGTLLGLTAAQTKAVRKPGKKVKSKKR